MIRLAQTSDLPAIAELFIEWAEEIDCVPTEASVTQLKSEVQEVMKQGAVFVYCGEDRINGMIGATIKKQPWKEHPTCYEQFFFVSKAERGNGILPILIAALESFAKMTGCEDVVLSPDEGTKRVNAITRLLQHYGYEITGVNVRKKINGMLLLDHHNQN